MYGGRVIDDFDRRIVRVYMDEYMGDFLFDTFQPFHFYRDENVDYRIPISQNRQEFIGECCAADSGKITNFFPLLSFVLVIVKIHFDDNRFNRLAAPRQYTGSIWFASECRN